MADETDNHASTSNSKSVEFTTAELAMRQNMQVLQNMIDFSNERLTGLRTMCATSAELTQTEIRCLETKFIRMLAEMLLLRTKMPERLSRESCTTTILQNYLQAVGLSVSSMTVLMQYVDNVETLLEKSDVKIVEILKRNPAVRDVEWQRVQRANHNLRRYLTSLKEGNKLPSSVDLYWDSWDRHHHTLHPKVTASPRSVRVCASKIKPPPNTPVNPTSQSPLEEAAQENRRRTISPENTSITRLTPSPSPPSSPSTSSSAFSSTRNDKPTPGPNRGYPTTPPSRRKLQTNLPPGKINPGYHISNAQTAAAYIPNDPSQLTKSKSHEGPPLTGLTAANSLANVNQIDHTSHQHAARSRLHTEPSPDNSSDISDHNTLHVPRTPGTPGGNLHRNPTGAPNPAESSYEAPLHGHRFNKKFKLIATCDQCSKQMFFGLKCKECKFRCHKDCEALVRSTCSGFKRQLTDTPFVHGGSPQMSNTRHTSLSGAGLGSYLTGRKDRKRSQDYNHSLGGPGAESAGSAESSCNSSTPSSPALLNQITTPITIAPKTQFKFPEVTHTPIYKPINIGNVTLEAHLKRQEKELKQLQLNYSMAPSSPRSKPRTTSPPEVVVVNPNNPSSVLPVVPTMKKDNALLNDGSLDNTDNTQSEDSSSKESPRSAIRVDSTDDPDDAQWSRQNSVSLKEWDIPFEDINLGEKIGDGRFGTVHRAQWHGAVAVKILKKDYLDTEAFRMEVAIFKKTRHENVVLFMGACIKPQAIVTSLCKGNTLYTHLHIRKDKFNMSRTTMVAHQIARGMGYLHDRNITHKDLKSKNIFIENGKVIITDFALFSVTKLEYHDRRGLCIPRGWLPYLAPEIMQRLTPYPPGQKDQLPFSFKSDVFAFGTIWYELLAQHHPYEDQCAESTIFKVGRGMKPPLTNIITTREVKEIMIKCWAYDVDMRPDFAFVCRQLDMLPKKRLARSPSHPVQLSRSAESVF